MSANSSQSLPPGVAARFAALAREGKADKVIETAGSAIYVFTKHMRDGGCVAGSAKEVCLMTLDPPSGYVKK
jgi:hypothetical protein